jgi:hypothetical protein
VGAAGPGSKGGRAFFMNGGHGRKWPSSGGRKGLLDYDLGGAATVLASRV